MLALVVPQIADLGLIAPARLGPFVGEARQQLGLSRDAFAGQTAGRLSSNDLLLLERGRLVCRERELSALQDVLGMPFAQQAPTRTRLIVDPSQGRLVVGGKVARVLPDMTDDELLLRYLTLVYLCRRARPGSYLVPRSDDVETLSDVLDRTPAQVRQRLARLPNLQRDALRLAVRTAANQRLLPGLGLFVGVHSGGALLMVDPDTPSTEPPAPQPTTSAQASTAAVVSFAAERDRLRRAAAVESPEG